MTLSRHLLKVQQAFRHLILKKSTKEIFRKRFSCGVSKELSCCNHRRLLRKKKLHVSLPGFSAGTRTSVVVTSGRLVAPRIGGRHLLSPAGNAFTPALTYVHQNKATEAAGSEI